MTTDNQKDPYDISHILGVGQTQRLSEKTLHDMSDLKLFLNTQQGERMLEILEARTTDVSSLHLAIGQGHGYLTAEQMIFVREGQNQLIRFLKLVKDGAYDGK